MFVEIKTDSEIAELAELAHSIWLEYYPTIIGEKAAQHIVETYQSNEAIKRDIAGGAKYFFIEEEDDKKCGYTAHVAETDALFISKLYVSKEYRGHKLGKSAIDFAAEQAKLLNKKKIYLHVNADNNNSIEFYSKCGLICKEKITTDFGNGVLCSDFVFEKTI